MQWIINKWAEYGVDLDIDALDQHGYTPLYLVCYKGYLGTDGIAASSPDTRMKRKLCVEALIKRGADINYITPKLNMTPLHWAAFQGDAELVQLLLENGAEQLANVYDLYPVDIAGFMNKAEVIMTFCKNLEKKIMVENARRLHN